MLFMCVLVINLSDNVKLSSLIKLWQSSQRIFPDTAAEAKRSRGQMRPRHSQKDDQKIKESTTSQDLNFIDEQFFGKIEETDTNEKN